VQREDSRRPGHLDEAPPIPIWPTHHLRRAQGGDREVRAQLRARRGLSDLRPCVPTGIYGGRASDPGTASGFELVRCVVRGDTGRICRRGGKKKCTPADVAEGGLVAAADPRRLKAIAGEAFSTAATGTSPSGMSPIWRRKSQGSQATIEGGQTSPRNEIQTRQDPPDSGWSSAGRSLLMSDDPGYS